MTLDTMPIAVQGLVFLAAGGLIFLIGPRLARRADELTRLLGLSQGIGGAVFLGASTSLSGTVLTVSAAWRGDADLALSNGLGGIAVQTLFLAVADTLHRRSNLEHAAASMVNIFQLGLLLTLIGLIVMAFAGPAVSLGSMHPVSLLLPLVWGVGTYVGHRVSRTPMWAPVKTAATSEIGEPDSRANTRRPVSTVTLFGVFAVLIGAAGFALSITTPALAQRVGISNSFAGAVITSTVTSLPELVTSIAAVRAGLLRLAVGNIIGGNAFDTLFCVLADAAYTEGSVYHAVGSRVLFVTALGLVMNTILLMGLIGREERGPGRIGTESVLIMVVYAAGVIALGTMFS